TVETRRLRRRNQQQNRRRTAQAASLLLAHAQKCCPAWLAFRHGPHYRRRNSRESSARAAAQCAGYRRTRLLAGSADFPLSRSTRKNRAGRIAAHIQSWRWNDFDRAVEKFRKSGGRAEAPPRALLPHWAHRLRSRRQTPHCFLRRAFSSITRALCSTASLWARLLALSSFRPLACPIQPHSSLSWFAACLFCRWS